MGPGIDLTTYLGPGRLMHLSMHVPGNDLSLRAAGVQRECTSSTGPLAAPLSATVGLGSFRLMHGLHINRNLVSGCNYFAHAVCVSFSRTNCNPVLLSSDVAQRFSATRTLRTCDSDLVWIRIFVNSGSTARARRRWWDV